MVEKVLVIGASGLVGSSLYERFSKEYEVIGTYNSHKFANLIHLDLLDISELKKILNEFNPSIILLPAALSSVEYCEENKDDCWKYNVTAPSNLIRLIGKSDTKLVFYSTDYIFNGEEGPYSEEDIPNPLNNYGKAKLETENNIINNISNYLILRTTVVYGWELLGKNFIYRLIENTKKHQVTKVPKDQNGTPTFVENVAEATLKLIKSNKFGIYNVAGSELMSRYEFAKIAAEIFNLDKNHIHPVLTTDLNQIASRPLNGGLKIDKLRKNIKINMMKPREGLVHMLKNKKNYTIINI